MKKLLIALLMVFGLTILAPLPALAQDSTSDTDAAKQSLCEGVGLTGGDCDAEEEGGGLKGMIRTVLNVLSFTVGVLAVIYVILGGIKYITSGGDPAKTASAMNTIIYAAVGVAVALLAQAMVRFVIDRVGATPAATTSTSLVKTA